jgi:excisionase family DNA binding protein
MTERTDQSDSEYETPAEASARTRLHTRTLARLADAGKLEAFYLPSGHRRYRRADIDRLLATGPEHTEHVA